MNLFSILKVIPVAILIPACSVNVDTNSTSIKFTDTLFKSYVLAVSKGDTIRRVDKIYFSPTDPSVDTSQFFFDACNPPCTNQDIYYVYFDRGKVVEFCDSMLNAIPQYKNQGDDPIFFERLTYEHLKKQAINNKMDGTIYVDELSVLLDRFSPLIINPKTVDRPAYIIVTCVNETHVGYKTLNFKTRTGDTVHLSTVITRPQDIEMKGEN